MRLLLPIILLASLILIAGCPSTEPARYEDADNLILTTTPPAEVEGCACMVCNYDEPEGLEKFWRWFTGPIFDWAPESRLLGGECKFVPCYTDGLVDAKLEADPDWTKPDDWRKAEDLAVADPDENVDFLKFFMVGQGPTFSDFDYANSYCNRSMGLAVRWYQPTEDLLYIPSKDRAGCYLDNDILPVYIFKPGEELESMPFTCDVGNNRKLCLLGELAEEMEDAGPVLIVPQPEFTSDENEVDDIATQIEIIASKCPDCMIAVVPKQTVTPDDVDEEGTAVPPNSALRKLADSHPDAFENVDMIGLHFFLNDYSSECRKDEAIYRLINYSKQTLAHYQKPSIILYYGAADYVDENGNGCTAQEVAAANDYLITNIPALATAGILGVSQYQLLDSGTNPAFSDLEDCGDKPYCNNLGLLDGAGDQKRPQFSLWFNRCQFYYNRSATPDEHGRGLFTQVPLTYPLNGENTSLCSFQTYIDLYQLAVSTSEQGIPVVTSELERLEVLGCDECIGTAPPERLYIGSDPPGFNPSDCGLYDLEAKRESEKCDLDPFLVKAVIWQESDFDPSAISHIPGTSESCATRFVDPSQVGCWTSTKNAEERGDEERTLESGESFRPPTTTLPECACGLMQVIDDWGTIPICSDYNPFVPSSSICGGTYKMCDFRTTVRSMFAYGDGVPLSALGVSEVDLDDPEYKWVEAWATLLAYNAGPGSLSTYYENFENLEGCYDLSDDTECCAYDFVEYVNTCEERDPVTNRMYGNPYAGQVIAKYDSILSTCPSLCPDGVTGFEDDPYEGQTDPNPFSSSCNWLQVNPYEHYPGDYMGLVPPVSGTCSSLYCANRGTYYHSGMDVAVPVGTEILASHDGIVYNVPDSGSGGYYVKLVGDRFTTYYMHVKCGGFLKITGEFVTAGTPIAKSGGADACKGHSTGAHLHFEVRGPTGARHSRMDPAYFVDICGVIPPEAYPGYS